MHLRGNNGADRGTEEDRNSRRALDGRGSRFSEQFIGARLDSVEAILPRLEGFTLIGFTPTEGQARIWRDLAGALRIAIGSTSFELELSSAGAGTGPRDLQNGFKLVNGSLAAHENSSSGVVSVVSTSGAIPIRAIARANPDGAGSRLECSFGDGREALGYEHPSTITALSLSGRENQVLFGDAEGGVYSAVGRASGELAVLRVLFINSAVDNDPERLLERSVVGISAMRDRAAAVTNGGVFVERVPQDLPRGPVSNLRRIGVPGGPKDITVYRRFSVQAGSRDSTAANPAEANHSTVERHEPCIRDFEYVTRDILVFATDRGLLFYRRSKREN